MINHPALLVDSENFRTHHPAIHRKLREHPGIRDFATSSKFRALGQILNSYNFFDNNLASCAQNPNKIVVFSKFPSTIALIENYLRSAFQFLRFLTLRSQQTKQQRHRAIQSFSLSPSVNLLLLTLKMGGLGLNLQAANVVIMFDHSFNPMADLQAMDRAHRLG